jgi:hypothetical protein
MKLAAGGVTLVLGASVALTAAADVRANTTVLDHVAEPTKVSVLGSRTVWSRRTSSGRYSLATSTGGPATRVPVGTRGVPFDVDLGRTAGGHVVATYSRCKRDPSAAFGEQWPLAQTARGCVPYEFDFSANRERRLSVPIPRGRSWMFPSRWDGRLAVFETVHGRRRGGRVVVMRNGRRSSFAGGKAGASDVPGGPTTVDVRGQRLAFDWRAESGTMRCPQGGQDPNDKIRPDVFEVRIGRLPQRPSVIATGCTWDANPAVVGASVQASGSVVFGAWDRSSQTLISGSPSAPPGFAAFEHAASVTVDGKRAVACVRDREDPLNPRWAIVTQTAPG